MSDQKRNWKDVLIPGKGEGDDGFTADYLRQIIKAKYCPRAKTILHPHYQLPDAAAVVVPPVLNAPVSPYVRPKPGAKPTVTVPTTRLEQRTPEVHQAEDKDPAETATDTGTPTQASALTAMPAAAPLSVPGPVDEPQESTPVNSDKGQEALDPVLAAWLEFEDAA